MRLLICTLSLLFTAAGLPRVTPKVLHILQSTTTSRPTTTTTTTEKFATTWECGTDDFTKEISEGEIMAKCPSLREVVNSCCYTHDSCYDAQSGQKFCDDNFCDCLELATRPVTSCHNESSPIFCDLVRTFGDSAYEASAPNATTLAPSELDYDYESTVKNGTL